MTSLLASLALWFAAVVLAVVAVAFLAYAITQVQRTPDPPGEGDAEAMGMLLVLAVVSLLPLALGCRSLVASGLALSRGTRRNAWSVAWSAMWTTVAFLMGFIGVNQTPPDIVPTVMTWAGFSVAGALAYATLVLALTLIAQRNG